MAQYGCGIAGSRTGAKGSGLLQYLGMACGRRVWIIGDLTEVMTSGLHYGRARY